jgi:hypothetical protein
MAEALLNRAVPGGQRGRQHDAALSAWTLCTVPDVTGALAEVRRVLMTACG